jgi:NADH-quinone oxidoreductase subunit D/NADH-quinone oxidoreductase subunit C/D
MSEAVAVAGAPAIDHPYNQSVPGAIVGTWADDTEKALFVAPDKLLALLTHLRDNESYDFLSNVTAVDYQSYKGKLRRHPGALRRRLSSVQHGQRGRTGLPACTRAR